VATARAAPSAKTPAFGVPCRAHTRPGVNGISSTKAYVYWWADGVYFNVRLDEERSCVLVIIGALQNGTKELLAVVDGYRESTQSWPELLQQLKRQGLQRAPKLAIGDGSLGFWLALREEYGPIAQQRCWVHKTANILDKMPKSVQGRAKQLLSRDLSLTDS
jgi:transposase-like protein